MHSGSPRPFNSYPVVYFVLVIPISIVRWVSGFGTGEKTLPSAATLSVACIYSLSGLANVFIFLFTRSDLFMEGGSQREGFSFDSGNTVALPPARQEDPNEVGLTVL